MPSALPSSPRCSSNYITNSTECSSFRFARHALLLVDAARHSPIRFERIALLVVNRRSKPSGASPRYEYAHSVRTQPSGCVSFWHDATFDTHRTIIAVVANRTVDAPMLTCMHPLRCMFDETKDVKNSPQPIPVLPVCTDAGRACLFFIPVRRSWNKPHRRVHIHR